MINARITFTCILYPQCIHVICVIYTSHRELTFHYQTPGQQGSLRCVVGRQVHGWCWAVDTNNGSRQLHAPRPWHWNKSDELREMRSLKQRWFVAKVCTLASSSYSLMAGNKMADSYSCSIFVRLSLVAFWNHKKSGDSLSICLQDSLSFTRFQTKTTKIKSQ